MILNMYVVKNELVNAYSGIYLFRSDAVASVELAYAESTKHPLDECSLYKIGSFDDESCKIVVLTQPVSIAFDTRRLPSKEKELPIS